MEPLIVAGTSRSGTELLRSVLNGHPEVGLAPETHYFDDLRPRITLADRSGPSPETKRLVSEYFSKLDRSAYGLSGAERTGPSRPLSSARLPDEIFKAHCLRTAEDIGKDLSKLVWWGEKTPRHVFCVDDIFSAYSAARMIVIVRDPRAVAASYRDWNNRWVDRMQVERELRTAIELEETRATRSYSLTLLALNWRSTVLTAEAAQIRYGKSRVHILRFEDLVQAPRRQIEDLCDFLGVAFHPGMLKVEHLNSSYVNKGENTGFTKTSVSRWQAKLSPEEVWLVGRLAGNSMKRWSYEASTGPAYPMFAMREFRAMVRRLPGVLLANRGRMGNPVLSVGRRIIGLFR